MPKSTLDGFKASRNVFSLPPLSSGEIFEDAYEVILVLDDREQFATRGSVAYYFFSSAVSFYDEASQWYFLFFLDMERVLGLKIVSNMNGPCIHALFRSHH